MTKSRLEAFSDGVLAIVITIMVLEMKIPHGSALQDLKPLFPVFISYVISFAFIAVYWGNHHHLLHSAHRVNSRIIWSNMLLLFFLSLIPFSSGWMGENHFEKVPVALYAFNLLLCAIAYYLLQNAILMDLPESNLLVQALKNKMFAGAALDVLTHEPPDSNHELFALPNCIITPHMAWTSKVARVELIKPINIMFSNNINHVLID